MGIVKGDAAKDLRKNLVKKEAEKKTFEEILESMSKNMLLALEGKKWDIKKQAAVDADRKKTVITYDKSKKQWWLLVSYGNELVYFWDGIKADEKNRDGAKKQAIDYLTELGAGKIGPEEKAEIQKKIDSARIRGTKLSTKASTSAKTAVKKA